MARIKYIINERRVAYEGAVQIITEGNQHDVLTSGERGAQSMLFLEDEKPEVLEPKAGTVENPVHRTAAERAAAGLVQPNLARK